MEAYKKEFIEFMVDSNVLRFGDFTLKSGRKSPFFMNAGAYGGEIKDSILGAQILLPDGTVVFWNKEELELGYRTSRIQKEDCIVLSAVFAWEDGNKEEIQQKMQELFSQQF